MPWRTALTLAASALTLAACSSSPTPVVVTIVPPAFTPAADQPALNCADYTTLPMKLDPHLNIVGRKCANPDGTTLWGVAVYQCFDGTQWPIFQKDPGVAQEPVTPEFDKCVGRMPQPLLGERAV